MQLHTDKINTLKLSGIGNILGIDLYKNLARVVELRSQGGVLNKFRSIYRPTNYFATEFPAESSVHQRGQHLADELKRRGVKTRFCVSTIRSANSRMVAAEIPRDLSEGSRFAGDDIQSWIRENYGKLIRVPVPLKELSFAYDIVSVDSESIHCEIAFVRASERDDVAELLKASGLYLLSLGLGARDFKAAVLADNHNLGEENHALIFAGEDELLCNVYEQGGQASWRKLQTHSVEEAAQYLEMEFGSLRKIFVTGPGAPIFSDGAIDVLNPIGMSPEYALAAGLAVRGFLPEIGAFDFCPDSVKMKSVEEKDKTLFKSTVLILGGLLLILFAAQYGVQSYFQNASDKLDNRLSQIGPIYSRVGILEHQVKELRQELNGHGLTQHRSHVAKVLHEIAEATPGGVWLYKLNCVRENNDEQLVSLWGYAETNEKAASYLGTLQENPRFSSTRVIRVGAPTEVESASFGSSRMHSFVTFEVRLTAR